MQAQILNGMYVFIYYFFSICLFIFTKNAVRKERRRGLRGGAPTWIFFLTGDTCASRRPIFSIQRQLKIPRSAVWSGLSQKKRSIDFAKNNKK